MDNSGNTRNQSWTLTCRAPMAVNVTRGMAGAEGTPKYGAAKSFKEAWLSDKGVSENQSNELRFTTLCQSRRSGYVQQQVELRRKGAGGRWAVSRAALKVYIAAVSKPMARCRKIAMAVELPKIVLQNGWCGSFSQVVVDNPQRQRLLFAKRFCI